MSARRATWLVALLVGVCFRGQALADDAGKVRWACWYDQALHLACTPEHARPPRAPASAPASPGLPRLLPPVVEDLRRHPARWLGRIVRIPLHTEPYDDALLAPLAQSVLCGARPGCQAVMVKGEAWSLEAAAAMADLHDPLIPAAR